MTKRPIEFRVWDGTRVGQFTGDLYFDEDGEVSINPSLTLMQSTGLLDKNGTKIFEGDILKHAGIRHDGTNYTLNYPVEWSMSVGYDEPGIGYNLSPDEVAKEEVIGNIYENPELLTDA